MSSPAAEDLDVRGRLGAHPVEPHPPVVLPLLLGQARRIEPADVVVGLAAGQPGDGGVPGTVDRALDLLAGRHVEHAQHALLGAALGELVGEQVPLHARLPRVERRQAGGVDGHRVDEHALGALGVHRDEDAVLLVTLPADEEAPVAAPDRDADHAGGEELAQPRGERGTARPGRGLLGEERVLGLRPGDRPGILDVLEPPVRVGHAVAVELLDEVEPFRWRDTPGRSAVVTPLTLGGGGERWVVRASCGHGTAWQDAEA